MKSRWVLAVVAPLVTVGAAVPASAASVRSLKASSVGPYAAEADGRYVRLPTDAYPPDPYLLDPTTAGIRDDTTGKVTRPAPGCAFTAPTSGYAGELCGDGVWRAVNLETDKRAVIDRGQRSTQPGNITEVGSHWAYFNGPVANYYVNWRTGAQVGASLFRPRPLDRSVDLDRSAARPRPVLVRGTVVQGIDSADIADRPYDEGPAGLPPGPKPLRSLRLRVGDAVRTIRSRCAADGCFSVQYANGILTWIESPLVNTEEPGAPTTATINAYVTRTRKRYVARIPLNRGIPTLVTHTARRIYAYAPPLYTGPNDLGGWTVNLPSHR